MRKLGVRKLIVIIVLVAATALIGVGAFGISRRASQQGLDLLATMRLRSVLMVSGEGVVEAIVAEAKKAAQQETRDAGGDMAAVREAVAVAEEAVRASLTAGKADYAVVDADALNAAIVRTEAAQRAYLAQRAADQLAYTEKLEAEGVPEATLVEEALDPASLSAEGDIAPDEMTMADETENVDLSGFVATEAMTLLLSEVDTAYADLTAALRVIYPELTDDILATLQDPIVSLIYQDRDKYETQYDRFSAYAGDSLGSNQTLAFIIRYGDDMVTIGIGLILLSLVIMFYRPLSAKLGLPRLIIGLFFVLLCVLAVIYDLSITSLLSNTIVRMGMNSVLVLAMLPGIQSGISLNLGLPIGIIGGLLGGLLCIELGMSGWGGFMFAIAVGICISTVTGILYGMLLNRLKGSEMAVTTYVGYSFVSLMCIAWMLLPFQSAALRWPLGKGLRVTLSLQSSYRHILNDLWSVTIGGIKIPTGLLLFMLLCCLLVWLFSRSKTGIAMQAVGNNARFAEATGISVNKMRIIGTTLSTVLGAVGIIVYSQSYGFMQLYTAPRQMGFIAASAILIGGASTTRARISHVLIGTFLFQGVLTLGMPVANVLVPQSTFSETLRILMSNGIILYALTKSGGDSRG